MTGKSEKREISKTKTSNIDLPKKRGRPKGAKNKPKPTTHVVAEKRPRGRPKGAKNKPKEQEAPTVIAIKKPRGRPKGSKNKIAAPEASKPDVKETVPVKVKKRANSVESCEKPIHPLIPAILWLEKTMHPSQLQYYRSRANKLELPQTSATTAVQTAIASDILGFFNVQDPEICKQVKRNTFVVNNV
jgi:hypothetical protein